MSVTSMLTTLKPTGALDPVRDVIFRPDVTDDTAWAGCFEAGFPDNDKKIGYAMDSTLVPRFHVDTNQVKDGEITSVKDLLDPKWKGRIILPDVRSGGNYPKPQRR